MTAASYLKDLGLADAGYTHVNCEPSSDVLYNKALTLGSG